MMTQQERTELARQLRLEAETARYAVEAQIRGLEWEVTWRSEQRALLAAEAAMTGRDLARQLRLEARTARWAMFEQDSGLAWEMHWRSEQQRVAR